VFKNFFHLFETSKPEVNRTESIQYDLWHNDYVVTHRCGKKNCCRFQDFTNA